MTQTVNLKIDLPSGASRHLMMHDHPSSEELAKNILSGGSYPPIPYIKDVQTVVDIGANVGLASAWFSLVYSPTRIIAVEPSPASFGLLAENAKQWPAIEPHNVGLFDSTRSALMFVCAKDSLTSSIYQWNQSAEATVTVELEDAETFLRRIGVIRIDVLKIDTEGCERQILASIKARLPAIQVIYVEYHSDDDRVWIDALLSPTHILSRGRVIHEHCGEFCYVARTACPPSVAAAFEIRSAEPSAALPSIKAD
jgi:FkbM family methyltransferase